jgi:hypothetical protein
MKLSFHFTNTPNIDELPSFDVLHTHINLPDEAKYLIGYEDRLNLVIGHMAKLTQACLYVTCKELEYKREPIKTDANLQAPNVNLFVQPMTTLFTFRRNLSRRTQSLKIRIYAPKDQDFPNSILSSIPRQITRRRTKQNVRIPVNLGDHWCKTEEQRIYANRVTEMVEQLLMLLNAEPIGSNETGWEFLGYFPYYYDENLRTKFNSTLSIE